MSAARFWWYAARCTRGISSLVLLAVLALASFTYAIARCRR